MVGATAGGLKTCGLFLPMSHSERLERVVASVKTLSATEMEELFKILHANACEYSRNNNGIFINLQWIGEELLGKVEQFIQFCHKSRRELDKYENLRKELHAAFQEAARSRAALFRGGAGAGVVVTATEEASDELEAEEVAEPAVEVAEPEVAETEADRKAGRVASTMRFYLLKKKFAKPNVVMSSRTTDVELSPEAYLIDV